MDIFNFLSKIFKRKRSTKIRVVIPKKFTRGNRVFNYDRLVKKHGRVWLDSELTNYVNGKKVKYWLLIYRPDSSWYEEYVPFFYRK